MENKTDIQINEKRLLKEFAQLTAIDSESFSERAMADLLIEKLRGLGFLTEEDGAGETYGGTAGNVYGFLPGSLPGNPILLSAHMDTVRPGCGKQALLHEDGRITSQGDTVLGADDVAGIVEILEGVRALQEAGVPHRSVEVLFPIGEEAYIKGTTQFDFSRIKAKEAYVLDLSGPIGTAAIKAPSIISFKVAVAGKASHAGFAPEDGVHAIAYMSRALSRLQMGHISKNTTFNVGIISGGVATNIVPDQCICKGEVRSYDHEEALQSIEYLRQVFHEALDGSDAEYQISMDIHMQAYGIDRADPVVVRFINACEALGLDGTLTETFGGSDNNNFVKNGIHGIVLSCGMYQVHSLQEYTTKSDLEKGAALVAQLLSF